MAIIDPDDHATLSKLREILPPGSLCHARLLGEAEPEPQLTPRQADIAPLLIRGLSNKEIARRLDVSHFTVRNQVSQILRALNVTTRHAARDALAKVQAAPLTER